MAGFGDELMATGMARGAAQRGKRIAFGDGRRIIWGPYAAEVFKGNPNIAPPSARRDRDIEWMPFYKGSRDYVRAGGQGFVWNYKFRPVPGQVFFDDAEESFAASVVPGFILIEPNLPWHKPVSVNKDWGIARYQAVVDRLLEQGHDVAQFSHGRDRLKGARTIEAKSFRMALAALRRAAAAVVPEGGLHHGAAAVGCSAVVLFGGFIPPQVTGYATHINLTGGAKPCGWLRPCKHCRAAMEAISVDHVVDSVQLLLERSKQ